MGCFTGCFGGSKDRKRRKQRNKVIPRDQRRHGDQNFVQTQTVVSTEEGIKEESSLPNLVSELRPESVLVKSQFSDKPEEQLSSNTRKKVTFDSKVTTYEHALVCGSVDSLPEGKEVSQKEKEDILVLSGDSRLNSEDDSITSSVGSYPPNHRYQNCRDSDDEEEEFGDCDSGDDDVEEEEEEEEDYSDYDNVDKRIIGQEVCSESVLTQSMESRTENVKDRLMFEEVESPLEMPFLPDQQVKTVSPKGYARNRSEYVHPVLNPVENLTQWKMVKSKGTSELKPQKENFLAEIEAPLPLSSEPSFKQSSFTLKQKSEPKKNSHHELAVDASLSTWLPGPESTPTKASLSSLETVTREKVSCTSQGSNSVRSFEDRPILGALTVEELKQLSAASLPKRSPSRSPDEMPIIGTVGTYWNDSVSSKDSRSASSYKGIPNTTSKYREDRRVNWHSTPFETRLERALKRGSGEA